MRRTYLDFVAFLFLVVAALVGAVTLTIHEVHKIQSSRSTNSIPATLDPSASFKSDLSQFNALVLKYQADSDAINKLPQVTALQAERDQITGMQVRLNGEIPKGYQWDEKIGKFIFVGPEEKK